METKNRWHDDTAKIINSYRDSFSKKEVKKYKLDLLLRIARRVVEFSDECGRCQLFQQEITRLTGDLSNSVQISALVPVPKATRRRYFKSIKNMVKHFQSHHQLVTKGHYVGLWSAIGSGVGVALGTGAGNFGIGMPIGIALGVAVGGSLDNKAKKEDRVI